MVQGRSVRFMFVTVVAVLIGLGAGFGWAQTTLTAGDIAVIGVNSDDPDQFAFVALVPLATGTEITFTDSGWTVAGAFRGNEGGVKFTASAPVSAGTVKLFSAPPSGEWSAANDALIGTSGFVLSTSGDQVLAFQGSSSAPTFIYGVSTYRDVWQTVDPQSSNSSALPVGLTNGVTAVAVGQAAADWDNAQYTGARSGADKSAILALVSSNANWTGSGSPLTLDTSAFTIGGADAAPSVVGTTPSNSAVGVPVDASISVTFSEDVTTLSSFFDVFCSASGTHTATDSGGPLTFTLDPAVNFDYGEVCTVTVFAASISDVDSNDPPDTMAADYVFSFATGAQATVAINEILADPGAATGDANGDGTVNTTQDEFVEIVNISGSDLDVSGWTVHDSGAMRHTFPVGSIIAADCSVVVFGGGAPTGTFGYSLVQVASTGSLGFNNDVDTVSVRNGGGYVVATYTYGAEVGADQSVTRDPDITGPEPLVQHSTASGSGGALFSPGTKIDGTAFAGCASDLPPTVASTTPTNGATWQAVDTDVVITFSEDVSVAAGWYGIACATSGSHTAAVTGGPLSYTVNPGVDFTNGETCTVTVVAANVTDTDAIDPPDAMAADYVFSFGIVPVMATPDVVINEFLADPGLTDGDANGDGTIDTSQDEFVELVNISGADLDVAGWSVHDSFSLRHTFPVGTVIPAGCAIVVFGGGTPTGSFGSALVQVTTAGLALSNSGDTIYVYDDSNALHDYYTFGVEAIVDQSMTLDPDISGLAFVTHGTATGSAGALFSPGTQIDGSNFAGCGVVVDDAPAVASTLPSTGAIDVALAANVSVTFSEDVILGSWYSISCATSGPHTAVVTGGPLSWTVDPDVDFDGGELCTVTVYAAGVSDADSNDPPDAPVADYVFTFTTVSAPVDQIFADGFETGDTIGWDITLAKTAGTEPRRVAGIELVPELQSSGDSRD